MTSVAAQFPTQEEKNFAAVHKYIKTVKNITEPSRRDLFKISADKSLFQRNKKKVLDTF